MQKFWFKLFWYWVQKLIIGQETKFLNHLIFFCNVQNSESFEKFNPDFLMMIVLFFHYFNAYTNRKNEFDWRKKILN